VVEENWSAEEELMLFEGIDSYGMGNWADISEFMESKTTEEIRDHYFSCFINSPQFPLPVSPSFGLHSKIPPFKPFFLLLLFLSLSFQVVDHSFTKEQIETLRAKRRSYRENWKPGEIFFSSFLPFFLISHTAWDSQ
jgi:hypothetical protein